jgi:hypothetical protein
MTDPVTPPDRAAADSAADAAAADAVAAESAAAEPAESAAAETAVPTTPGLGMAAPAAPAASTAPAGVTVAFPEATVAVAESKPRRRLALMAGLARLARLTVMVAIFVAGVALGYARFQATQPTTAAAAGPVTAGESTPISVHALIQALGRNDLDAARSSVSPLRNEAGEVITDPYRWLAGELQAMRLQAVSKVQLVGTFVDGQRTATVIVISGRSTQGADVARQLIVQTDNGNIVSFK